MTTSVTPAHAASYNGYFVFDKNADNQHNSTLTWKLFDTNRPQGPVLIEQKTWRAGSGLDSQNTCYRSHGWLPNGKYGGKLHMQYDGSLIKGVAFSLDNKNCHDGTPRTELFIHSEMKKNGDSGTTESTRWDGDGDYRSLGCVKLKPADMKAAAAEFKKHYVEGRHYSELLYVIS